MEENLTPKSCNYISLVDDLKDIDHLLDGTKQDKEKNLLPYNENHFDSLLYYTS